MACGRKQKNTSSKWLGYRVFVTIKVLVHADQKTIKVLPIQDSVLAATTHA